MTFGFHVVGIQQLIKEAKSPIFWSFVFVFFFFFLEGKQSIRDNNKIDRFANTYLLSSIYSVIPSQEGEDFSIKSPIIL